MSALKQSQVISLTDRERQVLRMLATGKTSKEIGRALEISWKTVQIHRNKLNRKFGVKTIAQLTQYAIAIRLIPIPEIIIEE